MTTTKTSERKSFYRRIRCLSDSDFTKVINFVDSLEACEPNEETISVLRDIEAGRNLLGPYDNLDAMFEDFGLNADSKSN